VWVARWHRQAGKYHPFEIVKDGRVIYDGLNPEQGIIPHDMVQLGVERALGQRGFLFRAAAGEAAGFRMEPEAVSDWIESVVEAFQAELREGQPIADDYIREMIANASFEHKRPVFDLSPEQITAIRDSLAALSALWMHTKIGSIAEVAL
jgi:hypothetical protein